MIIVSQDKRLLTKSLELSIENIEGKDAKKIMVEGNCGKLYFLGKYATEERAKEVLQEIIDCFIGIRALENIEKDLTFDENTQVRIRPKVYYMPED